MRNIRIGDYLVEEGHITPEQLQQVLQRQRESTDQKKFGEVIVEMGFMSDIKFAQALSVKLQTPFVDLNNVAVAINGGTPMNFCWVLSTVEPVKGHKIILDGGDEVILFGRAKVTDIPSQLNADTAMTGAVNFTDFGLYITGKIFSDHNNTNCVAAPK